MDCACTGVPADGYVRDAQTGAAKHHQGWNLTVFRALYDVGSFWVQGPGQGLNSTSAAHLCHAVAHVLGQVQVARLVDDVEPVLPDLAVVEDVRRQRWPRARQRRRAQQTRQDLLLRTTPGRETKVRKPSKVACGQGRRGDDGDGEPRRGCDPGQSWAGV